MPSISRRLRWLGALFGLFTLVSIIPYTYASGNDSPATQPHPQLAAGSRVRIDPLDPTGNPIRVGKSSYRGSIVLNSAGGIHFTNDISLDDYVKGISEVPNSWPPEALRAQAIAARTYAMWELRTKGKICPTQSCQVYTGVTKEKSEGGNRWVDAVNSTAGQVLLYNGKAIKAMFSSSNGGQSVSGSEPYLRPVSDPDDAASPLHHWSYSVPLANLAYHLNVPGTVTAVTGANGGVTISYVDSHNASHGMVIGSDTFRSRINSDFPAPSGRGVPMPGPRFSVSSSGGTVSVSGGGYGHGIGMSQYGALGKARRGLSADQIVSAYYGGIHPTTLDAAARPHIPVDMGSLGSSVAVHSDGPVRITDSGGNSHIAMFGDWQITSGGGILRLVATSTVDDAKVSNFSLTIPPTRQEAGSMSFVLSSAAEIRAQVISEEGKKLFDGPLTNRIYSDSKDKAMRTRQQNLAQYSVALGGNMRARLPAIKTAGAYQVNLIAIGSSGNSAVESAYFRIARQTTPEIVPGWLWAKPVVIPLPPEKRPWVFGAGLALLPPAILAFAIFRTLIPTRRRVPRYRRK